MAALGAALTLAGPITGPITGPGTGPVDPGARGTTSAVVTHERPQVSGAVPRPVLELPDQRAPRSIPSVRLAGVAEALSARRAQ